LILYKLSQADFVAHEMARRGGRIAEEARKSIEADTGKPVTTYQNAAQLNQVVTGMIEDVVAEQDDESGAREVEIDGTSLT